MMSDTYGIMQPGKRHKISDNVTTITAPVNFNTQTLLRQRLRFPSRQTSQKTNFARIVTLKNLLKGSTLKFIFFGLELIKYNLRESRL